MRGFEVLLELDEKFKLICHTVINIIFTSGKHMKLAGNPVYFLM